MTDYRRTYRRTLAAFAFLAASCVSANVVAADFGEHREPVEFGNYQK